MRGALCSAMFLVVALVAGMVHSWWALLALPAAVLIGLAFGAVGMFATTYMSSWQHFDYVTLAIQPMFLFSATFFPLSTYEVAPVGRAGDAALPRGRARAWAHAGGGGVGACSATSPTCWAPSASSAPRVRLLTRSGTARSRA